MSCLPASPASPSVSLEGKPENQTPETSGPKRLNAFAWFDPDTRCWRTYQASLLNPTSEPFSGTWPRAGMIVDGRLFRLLKWERRINEIGSGYWRTPTKHEGSGGPHGEKRHRPDATVQLRDQVANPKMWPTPRKRDHKDGRAEGTFGRDNPDLGKVVGQSKIKGSLNPDWVSWLMGWPIGADNLDPMPDLLWLDWEIDPADMERPDNWPTHKAGIAGMTAVNSDRPPEKSTHLTMQVHLRGRQSAGPIPRVATGIKDRVNRLKAIGNGQVPQCMATAWNILTGDWFNASP